ncbi:MAG: hypothetical protein ACFNZV_07310, partial [Rothia dentocariosa]
SGLAGADARGPARRPDPAVHAPSPVRDRHGRDGRALRECGPPCRYPEPFAVGAPVLRALFTAAPVGYLLVHIATIFMLDAALADPAHQPGTLNMLLPVDWALLLLSLAGIAYQLVRSVKDAASTFIAGGPSVEADGKPEE